jgi:peptidylprolyl isomerase
MKEGSVRRLPALLTAAALATVLASSLTACAGIPGIPGFGGCEPYYESGDTSELVTATGSGKTSPPDVEFPTPLIAVTPEVSTLIKGEGDPIPHRGTVDLRLSVYEGATGLEITNSHDTEAGFVRYVAGGDDRALVRAVQCAQVGERLVLTATARQILGDSVVENPQNGVNPDDTMVLVYDIIASYLGKADGINQLPQDGMPNVVTAPDGRPGITVPATEAPEELRVATVKAGGHETVEDGDNVVVQFSTFTWPAPGDVVNEVDSSWDGVPITVTVDEDATASATEGVPPVAAAQLVGTKVGSQLLVVIPPDDVSGETLIVVIDVLGIQK